MLPAAWHVPCRVRYGTPAAGGRGDRRRLRATRVRKGRGRPHPARPPAHACIPQAPRRGRRSLRSVCGCTRGMYHAWYVGLLPRTPRRMRVCGRGCGCRLRSSGSSRRCRTTSSSTTSTRTSATSSSPRCSAWTRRRETRSSRRHGRCGPNAGTACNAHRKPTHASRDRKRGLSPGRLARTGGPAEGAHPHAHHGSPGARAGFAAHATADLHVARRGSRGARVRRRKRRPAGHTGDCVGCSLSSFDSALPTAPEALRGSGPVC